MKLNVRTENDIEQLRRIALALQTQNAHLLEALRQKCRELESLKGSEQELQTTLRLIEQLETKEPVDASAPNGDGDASSESAPRKKPSRSGPTPQPSLAVVDAVFELDVADKSCRACGGALAPLAGAFEESEMVDVVDVSYRVVQVKRQKYVCRCGGCVETAPGPERVAPGSRYSLDMAIKVAVDKYLDHIPLERQERILKRHGLTITTQTLWDMLVLLGRRLERTSRALMSEVLSQRVIGLDQTSWKRLDASKSTPWQMWALSAPDLVTYRIRDDKSAETFANLLAGFEGTIVCDALATHAAGVRDAPKQRLAGCWAHVFRKFEEAKPDHMQAAIALDAIGRLYDIDAKANGDAVQLATLRSTESAAVLAELKEWLWAQAVLKTTSIGKAAAYTVANWERLILFVQDAHIPLDNNATERAIRGPVVGRKNHYGSRSQRGTEIASLFYSLLETAKLAGKDPAAYLRAAAIAGAAGESLLPHQFAG